MSKIEPKLISLMTSCIYVGKEGLDIRHIFFLQIFELLKPKLTYSFVDVIVQTVYKSIFHM